MAILDWDNFERIHGGAGGAWKAFENVCFELVRKKYGKESNVQKIRPFMGDHGIDIYVNHIGVEPIHIYQCKYFQNGLGKSQQNQIRESFSTIMSSEDYEVSSWTLMFPQDMTFEENIWWCKWEKRMSKRMPDIEISCLCGQALIQEIQDYGIYDKYFSGFTNDKYNDAEKKENAASVIESYIKNYTSVMFLQEGDEPQIRLMDLYISPEYEIFLSEVEKLDNPSLDLIEYIEVFANDDGKSSQNTLPVLFIEGHAGIGKTTFISKVAHDVQKAKILAGIKLYIVCLRDLVPSGKRINLHNPWMDFYEYLGICPSFEEFMVEMNEAVLILEGFDELSMIDNIQNENKSKYFNKLYHIMSQCKCNCHLIVTSRPDYLVEDNDWSKITFCKIIIKMKHLSKEKKQEWIYTAEQKGLRVRKSIKNNIVNSQKEDINVIISTPFTLYLIVHNNIELGTSYELWDIYFKIFGMETVKKSYDRIAHPSEILVDFIFDITREIAFFMFTHNRLDISWNEIEIVINNLEISNNDLERMKEIGVIHNNNFSEARIELRRLLRNNYALHTYYKRSENGGGLAFVHNYIKDFFVYEKISNTLNEAYKKLKPDKLNSDDIEQINIVYYELFSSNFLNEKVIEFLASNIRSEKKSNIETRTWIKRECSNFSQRVFPVVFSDMLINGFCYTDRIIKKIDSECIEKPINESYNLWVLYKKIYSYTKTNENYITMLINHEFKLGSKVKFFRILINELLSINKQLFSEINLQDIDISGTDFSKAYLFQCNYYKTNLIGADFSDAVINEGSLKSAKCMRGNFRKIYMNQVDANRTNFNNANLMNAELQKTNLKSTQFVEANLGGVTFRQCIFFSANFTKANLDECVIKNSKVHKCKFINTSLKRVNFQNTEFHDCVFRNIELEDANLENALFYGTDSIKGNFSKVNLRLTNFSNQRFKKCNFENCNFTGTDFSDAVLNKVCLVNADIKSAILKSIEFISSELNNCNLENADMWGAKLSRVSLEKSNLSYAKLHGCIIEKSNLSYATLNDISAMEAVFDETNLSDANLIRANLEYASFKRVNFKYANLSYANMMNADFYKADLREANLQGADMRGVNLEEANLTGANLIGVNLSNANLKNAIIKNTVFRGVLGKRKKGTIKYALLNNADMEGVKLRNMKGYTQEDVIKMLTYADCRKADFTSIPQYIKQMILK